MKGNTWLGPPLSILILGLCFVLSGCGEEGENVTGQSENQYDMATIVDVLKTTAPTKADSIYLASVPEHLWDEVEEYIHENGVTFCGEGDVTSTPITGSKVSCSWDGSTRRDKTVCEANQYKFQGHHAIYFIVDGPANCYGKDLDWWVLQCVPSHGCVSDWDLLLQGNWYWNGNKWVKNVALIVPTTWWVYYWYWTADFKARRFLLSWNDVNNGCCE